MVTSKQGTYRRKSARPQLTAGYLSSPYRNAILKIGALAEYYKSGDTSINQLTYE
jgi:hypothetical protein